MTQCRSYLPSATIQSLRQRADIVKRVRLFFDERGFFEVQTPVLSRDTVIDRFIEPIPVNFSRSSKTTGQGQQPHDRLWLQTSPEFCMKRLLAAGAEAIYQIGPALRGGEQGELHNIEFTMLEWYRVGDDYLQGIDLLDEFAQSLLGCAPAKRWTYRQLFQQFAQIDPFELDDRNTDVGRHSDLNDEDNAEYLNRILVDAVEPQLKTQGAVIVCDWPCGQSALAKVRRDNGFRVAERFELYVDGVELANGYHELTDADELQQRFQQINRQRVEEGRVALPENSRLIGAMKDGLPDCCGVALGIDRLVMLAMKKSSIAEVMAFAGNRA